jgi:hypothetical protein
MPPKKVSAPGTAAL